MIRLAVALLVLAVGVALPGLAQARNLYVFQIYDTDDATAGLLIRSASREIDHFFTEVVPQAIPDANLVSHRIDGSAFSIDAMRAILNPMGAFAPDDIVVVFYLGHGYDDPQSRLQMLNLPDNANGAGTYPAQRIVDAVASRRPGLLLAIFEACNVPLEDGVSTASGRSYDLDRVAALFNATGRIAMASSEEGQYSLISPAGGQFSSRMLDFFTAGATERATLSDFGAAMDVPMPTSMGFAQDPIVLSVN